MIIQESYSPDAQQMEKNIDFTFSKCKVFKVLDLLIVLQAHSDPEYHVLHSIDTFCLKY